MHRLVSAVCAVALLLSVAPSVALAQSDSGEIRIVVTDAATKKPIELARILLDGPVITNEFSGANGQVRFTDVPDGIYRARVVKRGYGAVTSAQFEVLEGRAVTVAVALAPDTGGLKVIATVTAKSTASISTTSLSDDSAQRRLSNDLADALNKLSGVSVTTSSDDSDATQTVSLEGHDASQTSLSLDGIPLNAPGSAGNLRGFSTDLFSGASVRFGPQAGSLGGGVSFRSLEPTLTWNSATSLSAGSNGKYNYSLAETGSAGKLGIAVQTTYRNSPSLLDGMRYEDASGLDYVHDGDFTSRGDLLKLRYKISDAQTLTGEFIGSNNYSDLVCARQSGPLPCGYGPGNFDVSNLNLFALSDTALVGDTSLQASISSMSMLSDNDQLNRYVAGVPSPTGFSTAAKNLNYSISAELPAQERHTISIQAYGSTGNVQSTPLTASSVPYYSGAQSSGYGVLQVSDSIRSSTKLSLSESFGLSRASNAPTSVLGTVAANWKPTSTDSYAASYSVGGVAAHPGRSTILTDPTSLAFNCDADTATGNAPGDQPGASSSTSARLSWTHQWKTGLVSTSLYRQSQLDVVLPTTVNGTVLQTMGLLPPGYVGLAQGVFQSPAGCSADPSVPFGAANLYFRTPVAIAQRLYEGGSISGYVSFGGLVVQPYYDVQVVQADSDSLVFNNPYSTIISGSQVPNQPLHTAGLTLDYKAKGSALEWLADAHYTGSNNHNDLPAFTTYDAGVTAQLDRGTLTFAMTNITNTYGGIFTSPLNAVPQTTAGGIVLPTLARPVAPRAVSVTWTFRTGAASHGSGGGDNGSGGPGGPGGRGGRGGGRGFGRFFQPLPSAPPADPLAINASNQACTADGQAQIKPVLDALRAYVAKIEAAKTAAGYPATMPAPAIPNVTVAYHGLGSTYALTVSDHSQSRLRSVFPCLTLHIATPDDVAAKQLFVPPATVFGAPQILFMPSVGFYFAQRPPQAGQESFRLYALPTKPPATPFEVRANEQCTPEMKSLATQLLGELSKHFAGGAATPSWTITPHVAPAGTYYELASDDTSAIPAMLNCGRVATGSTDDLKKLGWDGARLPSLNYAPALGIYMTRGTFGAGGPDGGRRRGQNGEGSPAPSPTPQPTASP